jgi:hypothetical protein
MAYKSSFSGMFAAQQDQQDGSSSSSGSSGGGYKSSFSGMFSSRKKREDELAQAQLEADMKKKDEAKKAADKKESEKNVAQRVGDFIGGVGNFVKDAAIDVKDTAVGAYTGVKDVVEGQVASNKLQGKTDLMNQRNKEFSQKFSSASDAQWNDPKFQAEAKKFTDETKRLTDEWDKKNNVKDINKQMDESQKVDATKTAFQAGETALNVGTLGIWTAPKAIAKQGAKAVVKAALKTGGKALVEKGIKEGGEAVVKKAAQEILEGGTKAAAKKLAGTAAKDATIGAAYGVTQTGKNADEDTSVNDYILNAAFGAGLGAAIPVAGAGIKKGLQKGKEALVGSAEKTAKITPDVKTQTNEVVQVVNPTTGEKTFYRIPADQRDSVVNGIDNARDGSAIAGERIDGKVTHVTAKSPEQMAKLGFKDGGTYSLPGDDVNSIINHAIEEQSGKYGTTLATRAKNWIGEQVNPYRALAKIDDQYAKMTGKQRHLLEADNNLEDLARRSAVSEREAASLFEKKLDVPTPDGNGSFQASAADLVKKYKGDSPAGLEFNNYTNAKFFQEIRSKKPNYQLPDGLTDENIDTFIKSYEAKNADAVKDLATKKRVNDMAVDYMADSGAISKEEAATIKSAYKNAVPLEKIFPDDLERAQVTGKNIGSIAKQTVVQKLETGSTLPVSNSFDSMLNRVYKAVSQGNRAKLAQKLLERADQGLIDGSKVMTTGANKAARNVLREQQAIITKGVKNLTNKTKVSNRQMRKIASELNKLNKEGLNISLKSGGKNSLPGFKTELLDKLSNQKGKTVSSRAFFKSLIEADPAQLERVRKKIATREPKLAAKLDEVANYRREIDALKAVKTDLREVTAEFADDPTTGKQVISGLIDGEPYKIEVPPAIAKAVQGLDQKKVDGILKVFATLKKPFEVTWTGVFNPVFASVSYLFYDTPMSYINSPQGRKVFAPKAVLEGIKSFKSSSKFQRALAAEGARPYGGSGASAFTKPDAKALASQRNILTSLKFTASHPEVALSKLDVWGGKLANSTRTRIARAEYDAFLKTAKKAGEDIKSPEVQQRAMRQAALAYRTIMPDYDTMSHLTRQVNSVVPFYAASVAGTRSFGQAIKRDPRNTLIKAATVGVLPTIGITAFNMANPQGRAFYQDMEDNGQTRTLDDNLVVVLPGAHKDDSTGEWTGIVKIPLAPEFRAINQTTWRATRDMATGSNDLDTAHVAWSIFDTITGGVRSSENPLVSTRRILSGEDPQTGERIIKGDMANLPTEDQVYEWTSGAGKVVGKVLNTSPIQGDKILSQFGLVGATAKNGGKPVEATVENVTNRVSGAYGETASKSFFNTYSPLKAKRDKASKEVTDLVKAGRRNEATRKANEFNDTLRGSFGNFQEKYGQSDAFDPAWNDLMSGLIIKTGDRSFDARYKQ